MNSEFFDALNILEREKGLGADELLEKIKVAIALAVKKDNGGCEAIFVDIDPESQKFNVTLTKTVVEEINDAANEIIIGDALRISKKAAVGEPIEIKLDTTRIGRIAAVAAKHVIKQGIREAERNKVYEQYQSKMHELVTGIVQKIEPTGNLILDIDGNEVELWRSELLPDDRFKEGSHVKVYVMDVVSNDRRCIMKVSRTNKNFVKRLLELEIPEISDGEIEIRAIAREPGLRSKVAVWSNNEDIEPVGACIGSRGLRLNSIINELGGEKLDVIKYSEDPAEFISNALAPAKVVGVQITDEEQRTARVKVPDHMLSLAIGKKGIGVKLAAKITRYKIDIRPESGYFGELSED
ncbi:MAG: transcription termination factor NusA [Oscillospiraceae bacterium]|nr:transcription termination factor NusA [Oscillospiraceae bacterium]